jgi:hypothetical protein
MKNLNLFLVLFTVIYCFSCKKGDDGAQGPPGTANVIYSDWVNATFTPVKDNNGDTLFFQSVIDAPKLVDSIVNKGSVKVYANMNFYSATPATPFVTLLPLTDLTLFFGLNITPYFSPQKITLIANDDVSTFTDNNIKYFQYRYVIIPGGAPARMPTINLNNYEEVKKYLNLKD